MLIIEAPYSEVIGYTAKANKEVYVNLHYVKLNDYFTIDFQLYGQKVVVEQKPEKIEL